MKTNYTLVALLAGAALLVALAVVMSFRALGQTKAASDARKQSYALIIRANALLSDLKDAETGQRGYILTGNEEFLKPYLAVCDGLSGHLQELRALVPAGGEAREHLDALVPLVDAKLTELALVVEHRRHEGMNNAVAIIGKGEGRRLMDSIRAGMGEFIQIEEGELTRHDVVLQMNLSRLFAIVVSASLLALVLALAFAYLVYRDAQSRLKDLVHLETRHLLGLQESANRNLQQANAALQVSEEKFAVTLNSIGDAVMATDAGGRVTLLNPLAEQLTGWSLADAAGRPADEIFHIINEKTGQPSPNPVNAALAAGTKQIMVNHILLIARDGTECAIADSCAPIRDRSGGVVGAVLVFRDVSERKEIETGLEKTRQDLEAIKRSADEASEFAESIINTVREPLISLDQDLRVVTASRSFYEVFKVNPKDTLGQLIYDLGNKQWDIPKLRELLETILPQKATFDNYAVEHDFTTIGRRIMLLNARQIRRVSGKERIILLAIEDITERREIETGLEKAHEELKTLATELKRTARAKSEFLANMSHELRTPLNSINGFSEVLYDETFGPLNEKQKRYVDNVLTSGKHLLLLINQILDMAKVESGKMNLALSSLSTSSLLNEITMLVADMVSKKKLHMELEIAADLPAIEGDELKEKEIIYNLISNAVKFTPEGGRIGMRAKNAGSEIEIVVWDTGDGIASENMEKIFEGFFRVDTPYSRVTEGTGLGLPLSRKLVELHGGTLSVESEGLNKGTSVRFTLPIGSRSGA